MDSGFTILAFPSNQFANQEPGSGIDIKEFARKQKLQFEMFAKIMVNGDEAHPLWKYLKMRQGSFVGDFIKWNFTKFLIDKNGQPIKRYAPTVPPTVRLDCCSVGERGTNYSPLSSILSILV